MCDKYIEILLISCRNEKIIENFKIGKICVNSEIRKNRKTGSKYPVKPGKYNIHDEYAPKNRKIFEKKRGKMTKKAFSKECLRYLIIVRI